MREFPDESDVVPVSEKELDEVRGDESDPALIQTESLCVDIMESLTEAVLETDSVRLDDCDTVEV